MQPQMRPLLMAARYFAVGLVPIIVTQVIPIWWLGEPLITGDFVYFCVVFTGLGFATLNSPDYSSFTNTIDKRMVAIMSALIIHILYSYGRTFNIPFLSDLLLIVLIVVGILRSGLWQQKIIKDVFGQGELSADFMQSAANQLAPSTYERIRQVTLEAADALNVAHVVLLVEDGQREWRTIVSDESISTNAWPEWLLYEVQETKWFDGVHPLSGLPDWIRLAVPLHGIDAPQGYLILSSPRDTAQFHTHQRSQIETFSNLLLNAIQTASVKQQEAFFVDELMRVDADTRQEIGTRIHAELLDKISALSREPALQTGVPQQLLSEIASSARDIMDQVYPIDYSQNVYDVVMATVTLCQTADVDIELNRPNLADCHLPEAQRRSVSMVLQEALANALKHAKPTYISTTVAAACGELTISVRDNGQASVTYHPGHGLRSIRHWVEAHGGTYHITPNPNGGTFFFCTMNYDPL
jgi:signal transduction histidine kinase